MNEQITYRGWPASYCDFYEDITLLVPELPETQLKPIYENLTSMYQQEDRNYHNLIHIQKVLVFARNTFPTKLTPEISLAIWYHDIISIVGDSTNEEQSAFLANTILTGIGVQQTSVTKICKLILATRHQLPISPKDEEAAIIRDCDIHEFGTSNYFLNASLLEDEETEAGICEPDFSKGQVAFLKMLLAKPNIFATKECSYLEESARNNIRTELSYRESMVAKFEQMCKCDDPDCDCNSAEE